MTLFLNSNSNLSTSLALKADFYTWEIFGMWAVFFVPSPEMCSRYVWENPRSRTGNSQQEREFLLFEFTSKQKKLSAKKTAAVSVTYPITFSLISAQAFSGWEPEQCKSPLPQLTEGGIVQNRSRPGEGDTRESKSRVSNSRRGE